MSTLAVAPLFAAPVRRWLPADFDATDETRFSSACAELTARAPRGVEQLLAWMADLDELESALDAAESRAQIAAMRDTQDAAARRRHLDLQQRVKPAARAALDGLDRLYLECHGRSALDPTAWLCYDRLRANRAALHRPENLPLLARESELALRHDERLGGLLVSFRGDAHTLPAMSRWLEEADRGLREQAWLAVQRARFGIAPDLSALFDELARLRGQIASNAGFENYRDYRFRDLERFDYGVEDCERFHEAVEQHVVPALVELRGRRAAALGLDALRPWDLNVDAGGRAPLRPFRHADELGRLARAVLARVDPAAGEAFDFLLGQGLTDLDNRPGKAPGAFSRTLHDVRMPFVYANSVGRMDDVRVVLHEAGHAWHALLCRDRPALSLRRAPKEFAEVASMGMEALGFEQLGAVMSEADAARARRDQLERALTILPWAATADAFQQWLYTYPEHTADERAEHWLALRRRFEPDVDWTGHEALLAVDWQRQLHLFKYPFYYIEYGIAQVGALQVWLNWRNHGAQAVSAYRAALALGGSRPLPELFTTAHACFDFGPAMIETLTAAVMEALRD
jgi:oligoendopeptidase F